MNHLLIAKDLYGYKDRSIAVLADTAEAPVKAEHKSKWAKALSDIILLVIDEVLYLVSECKTPKAARDNLQSHLSVTCWLTVCF